MSKEEGIGRRSFLKCSASGLAAASALSGALAGGLSRSAEAAPADKPKDRRPPSERLVVGVIGTGGLGRGHHLNTLLNDKQIKARVDVAAVCDVDLNRATEAAQDCMAKAGRRVDVYQDFRELVDRKDIDAVFVVTPDHWHTLVSIAAMEAGKDVYCEKPLTLTVEEGKAIVAAARRYGTVFQTGSQQRSDGRFRQACELVRNGRIGKIKRVDTVLHSVGAGQWNPVQTPPPYFDWNMWLGQTPYTGYIPGLVHYEFRWQYEYSGGVMTDWGAHHNDIAQWGLGMDHSGPVSVDGTQATFHENGPYSVAGDFDVHYQYANGVDLYCHTKPQSYDDGTKFGNGIKFTGEKGWIFVSRSEIQASDREILKGDPGPIKLYKSDNHHLNWLDCIVSRERCICDVEIGYRSVSVCHIGNISMRLGRPLKWDPEKVEFVGDEQANRMLSRSMRAPWHL